MEKVWRSVYSAVFFCSFNLLSRRVLLNSQERIELQLHEWRVNRGSRPRKI